MGNPMSWLEVLSSSPRVEAVQTPNPVEIATEAALLVMRSGGSTVAAERSFTNILKVHKEKVTTVWRIDFVAISNATKGQSSTVVQPVGPLGVNLFRASEVEVLGERAAKGEIATTALGAEIERIKHLPSPYNRPVMILAAAFTGACFSQIQGGDWGSAGIAFVAAAVGQFLRLLLQAREVAVARTTLVCGLLSALIACAGMRLGFSHVEPATLIASVIYMVPGLPLINGFLDMVSHKYLFVGFERIVNAAFLFLILAIDIALAQTLLL